MYHNLATMVEIGKVINGSYEDGTYLAIQSNGKAEDLKRVPFGTSFSQIIDVDKDKIKAIRIGTRLYSNTLLDEKVTADMAYGDHLIKVLTKDVCIVTEVKKSTG